VLYNFVFNFPKFSTLVVIPILSFVLPQLTNIYIVNLNSSFTSTCKCQNPYRTIFKIIPRSASCFTVLD